MKVSRGKLAALIAERSLQSADAPALSQEIAAYLLSEGRSGELDSLLRDIMQYRADHGIVEVIAVTAHPLSDGVRRDIEAVIRSQYPSAQQVIISEEHDGAVIGGVKLVLANQQLDLSIRAKLNRFRQLTVAPGGV
jgi:F0F1-type ATP synthase delta subunit